MSLTVQFYTMLSMVAFGLFIGATLDTYRRFLKTKPSFHWLTAIYDLLFWIIQGALLFYILFIVNKGEVRFYVFLAILCGFAAYQALLKKGYNYLLELVIRAIIGIYHFIKQLLTIILIKPIKFILKLFYSLCMMVITTLFTILLFILKMVWKLISWVLNVILTITRLNKITDKMIIRLKIKVKKIKGFLTKRGKK
ncbi:spore cortex biosynthesis protein YabQ [Alkalihalobacillus trypoxylicola]|uniref:Spore coat protein n=1 Tax=Alkalihalobacillus trypoxylicola TaxID=519424 RepID=A0A162EN72_9BACI|nr:spore cortex biosynthesis protein YabQ [Alkalihalobacillus trypoxylicola]KYG33310.1 spore coat protein [Alkalihalobacillus trypoxylicola]